MYFKLFNFKIPKTFLIKEKQSWTYLQLLNSLNFLLKKFISEYNSFVRKVKNYGYENKDEWTLEKRYKKFHRNLHVFMSILQECINRKITIYEYYKQKNRNSKYSERWFKYTKEKLLSLLCKKTYISFREHLYKATVKKDNDYIYSPHLRKIICDYYYEQKEIYFINKTTMWLKLVNKEIFSKFFDFTNLSFLTLRRILLEDERAWPKNVMNISKDHPFRNKPKPIGGIQIDLKIFGRLQTGLGKYIYSIECIETSSRVAWGIPLEKPDTKNVMEAIVEIIDFFESLGIKVKKIRTDNPMMFKNINFVHSNEFNEFCKAKNIIHDFSYLGEPECNGCVERLHLTYDHELVEALKKARDFSDIKRIFKRFFYYYNYERYLHYNELKNLAYKKRFMKPIDALAFFKKYKFDK